MSDDRDEVQRFLGALSSEEQLDAIESVGKFKCRKKLSSGAVVTFSYEESKSDHADEKVT